MKNETYEYTGHLVVMSYIVGPLFAILAILLAGMMLYQISEAMTANQLIVRLPLIALLIPVELVLIFGSWTLISGIALLNSGGIEVNDNGVFDLRSGEQFKWEEISTFRELNLLKRARFYGEGGEKLFDVHQSLDSYSRFKELVAKKMAEVSGDEVFRGDLPCTFSVVGEMTLRAVPTILVATILLFAGGVPTMKQVFTLLGVIAIVTGARIALHVRDILWLTINEEGVVFRTWFSRKEYRFNQIKSVRFGERQLSTGKNGRWTVPELRLVFKDGFETEMAGKRALEAYTMIRSFVVSETPEKVDYVGELEEFLLSEHSETEKNEIVLEL